LNKRPRQASRRQLTPIDAGCIDRVEPIPQYRLVEAKAKKGSKVSDNVLQRLPFYSAALGNHKLFHGPS